MTGGAETGVGDAAIRAAVDAAEVFHLDDRDDAAALVADINQRHALVLVGGRALILYEGENEVDLVQVGAFGEWFRNRHIRVGDKRRTFAEVWLTHPLRRQFRRIVFAPEGAPEGDYNLWRGFAVEPGPGDCSKFTDHILDNVCQENTGLYDWVIGWFAHIFQHPGERVDTALVLRGLQGTGKTKVGEVVGSLIGPAHYNLVDDARYVTGQFNSHMAACLLLQADEAVWAGNRDAEGRLKGLITASHQFIEKKGVDAVKVRNLVRLLMTSNADWVVPAGPEERRFAVLDVGEERIQDHAYFAAIDKQMDEGGREALLDYLLKFDLSGVDLRRIPVTEALWHQKLHSLGDVESWWFERVRAGAVLPDHDNWVTEVPRDDLRGAYWAWSERIGYRRRVGQEQFRLRLQALVPTLGESRPTMSVPSKVSTVDDRKRVRCYTLPGLEECRAAFAKFVGYEPDWPLETGE